MDSVSQPLNDLRTFRDSLYRCFERRADALFELADALLTAAGSVPSPVHLSLVPAHRRGWGSLYAALRCGRIVEGPLRELLARHASAGEASHAPVYAVDVSVWSRCDAESSPGRGYYYHPSRHSAGQPIVAGWAYQLIAGLSFERDSWVAPMDARRVRPEEDANDVAVEQAKDLLERSSRRGAAPLFVFDAGYDPVKLQRGLEGRRAHVLVRLHSKPRLLRRPRRGREKAGGAPAPPRQEVRPSRPPNLAGARPRAPLHDGGLRRGTRQGVAGVAPEDAPHSRALRVREGARRARHRGPGGGGQAPPPDPRAQEAVALVLRRGRTGSRSVVAGLRQEVRPGAHDPLPQADARVDHAEGQAPRTGGPLDLARHRRLRPTEAGPLVRGGPPTAVGAPAARATVDAMADAAGFRDAPGGGGHAGKGAETLREVAGTAQRAPLGPGEALPGTQESRLNRERMPEEDFAADIKTVAKFPTVKRQDTYGLRITNQLTS